MKPWGMTPDYRIRRSTRVQDAIYEAVSEAIDVGMSPEEFKQESRDCWDIRLSEKRTQDASEWDR